jgi:hypothetical protein
VEICRSARCEVSDTSNNPGVMDDAKINDLPSWAQQYTEGIVVPVSSRDAPMREAAALSLSGITAWEDPVYVIGILLLVSP